MTRPIDVAQRRALVVQMSRDKVPIRTMARLLGVTKDVIYRDRQALNATPSATPATQADQHRRLVEDTATTLQDLRDIVTAVVEARPAYQLFVDNTMAAQWYAQLRDDAAALQAVAASFRDYYPHLVASSATPARDEQPGRH